MEFFTNVLHSCHANMWEYAAFVCAGLITVWCVSVILDRWLEPIPSPIPFPVFHHLPYFLLALWNGGIMSLFDRWADKYRSVGFFRYTATSGERIVVLDKDFARHLFLSSSYKYGRCIAQINKAIPSMKGGIFTANGKDHVHQKKLLSPLFTRNSINQFTRCFNTYTDKLIKAWSNSSGASSESGIDVMIGLDAFALDVLGECIFGHKFSALESGQSPIRSAFEKILKGKVDIRFRILSLILPVVRMLPVAAYQESEDAEKVTNEVLDNIINSCKGQGKFDDGENVNLVATLLAAEDSSVGDPLLGDRIVRSNMFTFLIAGHETTSASLMWTLYCMAKYPEVQRKLRDEITLIIDEGTTLIQDDLDKLPYLGAVIDETMRLYTVTPILTREAITDDVYNGRRIIKGTSFAILCYQIHTDPTLWDDPLAYKPERFLEQHGGKEHRDFSFLPFAAGSHMCIGRKFALLEMKIVLAKLLVSLQFSLACEQHFKRDFKITMKANPPIRLRVTRVA